MSMNPRVSICLPNLNTFPFLQERFDTILGQTLQDWELFVYDSHSDDGSWELIERLATKDERVRIAQGPRAGVYPAWNECLRGTSAEYVYIATSDDAMAPDCLERMVAALDRHADCDVAHCALVVVDDGGRPFADQWWLRGLFAQSFPELVTQPHVRKAPYDGLLCLSGQQVYYSITEMLIRRSLFAKIGSFESRWGAVSDFHWYMRVGLAANTVHVPDTWATWRMHPKQSTAFAGLRTVEHDRKIDDMIDDAVRTCEPYLHCAVVAGLKSHWLDWSREMRAYYSGLHHRSGAVDRRLFQLSQVLAGTPTARSEVIGRLAGKPTWPEVAPVEIRRWLESVGIDPVAMPAPSSNV
jgi:glycosyltransferase involved in cell wall biosynthesis